MHIFLIILEILLSIVLVVSILLQPSKTDGFKGFITGNSDTFYSKNKSRTKEALMAKVTIISAILFALTTIALNIIKK